MAFIWNHEKELMTSHQIAAYGAGTWTRRRVSAVMLDVQRRYLGLAVNPWIYTNLDFVLFVAAHTAGGNYDDRDECYRGAREAIRAGQGFHRGDFALYDQIADSSMDMYSLIEEETWYGKWQEWWHNRDILTSSPRGLNPYRMDLASHTWNELVEEHISGPPFVVVTRNTAI